MTLPFFHPDRPLLGNGRPADLSGSFALPNLTIVPWKGELRLAAMIPTEAKSARWFESPTLPSELEIHLQAYLDDPEGFLVAVLKWPGYSKASSQPLDLSSIGL